MSPLRRGAWDNLSAEGKRVCFVFCDDDNDDDDDGDDDRVLCVFLTLAMDSCCVNWNFAFWVRPEKPDCGNRVFGAPCVLTRGVCLGTLHLGNGPLVVSVFENIFKHILKNTN